MDRRLFMKSAGLLTATALVAPRFAQAAANAFTPSPSNGWRLFEITTRIELPRAESATRVWVPLPSITEAQWIKPIGNHWEGNAAAISLERDPRYGAEMLMASWKAGEAAPVIEVKSLFSTRDRTIDFSKPGKVAALDLVTASHETKLEVLVEVQLWRNDVVVVLIVDRTEIHQHLLARIRLKIWILVHRRRGFPRVHDHESHLLTLSWEGTSLPGIGIVIIGVDIRPAHVTG